MHIGPRRSLEIKVLEE
uniref:Uncharacterized protein n=1 Tax=Lepeophtheirus salmonis TaxID=72036 RepID=A0A0K2U4S6_LEPSM